MILLTGATGFVGGHLLDALVDTFGSENIVALTSKPITKCRFLLHNGYSYVDDFFIKTDFADIDTIIHAGAFIPKSGAESNDILNCNSNILSTTRLITSTLHKIQKFIFLSTIDVYGCANTITEDTVTEPISLYGYSKLYCEKLITIWATQKSLNHQILRIGHVYGPGEEKYKKIIKRSSFFPNSYLEWAKINVYKKDYKKAITINKIALSVLPDLNNPYLNLEHEEYVEKFVIEVYQNIAYCYMELKEYEEALNYYLKIIKLNSYKIEAYKSISDVCYLLKDIDKAIWYNKRGYMLNPNDYFWSFSIALLYEEKGDNKNALEYAKKALKLYPENESIKKLIEKL